MPTLIKNGKNYSGTSVSLTQAEYDALPEVTKMNGTTYFITDSEVVLNAEDVALDEGNLNDLAGSVATIETSPATANHEVGEYILWNGVVYVVTSAIATGENLVINSNISARTIGSELTALNNGLTTYTDGIWTVRKLPDGTAECWGKYMLESGAFSPDGALYYRITPAIPFPSNLFTEAPVITANVRFGNMGACAISEAERTIMRITIISASSSARSVACTIHAIGRWI